MELKELKNFAVEMIKKHPDKRETIVEMWELCYDLHHKGDNEDIKLCYANIKNLTNGNSEN